MSLHTQSRGFGYVTVRTWCEERTRKLISDFTTLLNRRVKVTKKEEMSKNRSVQYSEDVEEDGKMDENMQMSKTSKVR